MAELDDALSGSRRYALEELRGKLYRDQGIDYVPGYRRGSFDDSPTAESVSREESQGHATARWLKNVEKGMEDQELIKKNEDYPRIRGPQKISETFSPSGANEPPAGGPREMIGRIKEGARDIRRGTQHLPWKRQDVFGGAAKIATAPFTVAADQVGMLLEAVTRGLITKDQFETALTALRGGELPTKSSAKMEQWIDRLPAELDKASETIRDLERQAAEADRARKEAIERFWSLKDKDPNPSRESSRLWDEVRRASDHHESLLNQLNRVDPENAIRRSLGMWGLTPENAQIKSLQDLAHRTGVSGISQSDLESFEKRLPELRRQGVTPLFDPEKGMPKKPRTFDDALREQNATTEEEEPGITYSPSGRKLIDDRKLHENNQGGFRTKPMSRAGEQRDQTASIIENLRRPRPHAVTEGERGGMQQNPALVEQRRRLQEALPDFTSKAVKVPPEDQPLLREVWERSRTRPEGSKYYTRWGKGTRPIETERLPIGKEQNIIDAAMHNAAPVVPWPEDANVVQGVHSTAKEFSQFRKFQESDAGYWGNGVYMFPKEYAEEFGRRTKDFAEKNIPAGGVGYGTMRGRDPARSMLLDMRTEKPFNIEHSGKFGEEASFSGDFDALKEHGWPYDGPPVYAWNKAQEQYYAAAKALERQMAIERGLDPNGYHWDLYSEALKKAPIPFEATSDGQKALSRQFTKALLDAGYDSISVSEKGGKPYEMIAIKPGSLRGTYTGSDVLPPGTLP